MSRVFVSFVVGSALLLGIPASADAVTFPDVGRDHPAFADIAALSNEGIFSGFPGGQFYPSRPMTRAEFLKIVVLATGIPVDFTVTTPFLDVPSTYSLAPYVAAAAERGLIGGREKGLFYPDVSITRFEAVKILLTAHKVDLTNVVSAPFSDVTAPPMVVASLNRAAQLGIIQGYPQKATGWRCEGIDCVPIVPPNRFLPFADLTRAEAATMLSRARLVLQMDGSL